jgi:hypothetical protein
MPFNVEYENEGYPRLVIGGLTPKWYIEERSKGEYSVVRVKWVTDKFKPMKPNKMESFRAALLYIVYKEAAEEYSTITGDIVSGEVQEPPKRRKHFFKRSK